MIKNLPPVVGGRARDGNILQTCSWLIDGFHGFVSFYCGCCLFESVMSMHLTPASIRRRQHQQLYILRRHHRYHQQHCQRHSDKSCHDDLLIPHLANRSSMLGRCESQEKFPYIWSVLSFLTRFCLY